METSCDIAIVGGGHNGLVCAYYLARAGRSVMVLEKNPVVGGAALTEEFHPGFRNSVASYTVGLLHPKIISDLDLPRHGLRIVERPVANFWPVEAGQGSGLILSGGLAQKQMAIAAFSAQDAARLPAYENALEQAAALLRELLLEVPPNAGGGWRDMLRLLQTGRRFRRLSLQQQQLLTELFTRSASAFLDRWFENDRVKAALAFDSIVGTWASPSTPGTAYVLLHHCFGEVNGKRGVWGHAMGGMGSITRAMAAAASAAGARIHTDAEVCDLQHDGKRIAALTLTNGDVVRARAVAVNIPPKLLFRDFLPELDDPVSSACRHIESGSGSFRMNVALAELPSFSCQPGNQQQPHHGAGIIIGPSMDYLERAWLSARSKGWSDTPVIELLLPSTLDDSLAPPGQHVASLFVQHVSPQLPAGRSWADPAEKAAFANVVIDTVTHYAANFRSSILAVQSLSPLDLEQRFGMVDGDIFHGQLNHGQLWSLRPVPGAASYRLPLLGLYLCGSGAHPGGGVTGIPGHNAAREILRDWKQLAKQQISN